MRAAAAIALLYAVGATLWYATTPLGRAPVLDGREMTDLARAIGAGTLPHEPFYRAPLYPALLAVPVALGVDPAWLPALARVLNLLAHAASALLIAALARRLGARPAAAAGTGLAWLVYPVALHFVGDPLDVSVGIALALGGTLLAVRAMESSRPRDALAAGVLLALATLARPQFLAVLGAFGVVLALVGWRRRAAQPTLAYGAGGALVLLAMALVNVNVGGEARVLPWQGAYALWAANRPESNHRYYTQISQVRDVDAHVNPMRLEAEHLYRSESGATGPLDIDAMNRHWRERMIARVAAAPEAVVRGYAQHALHVVHDAEPYDNKTYSFHKQASPWLRYNPLGFGLLLVAAVAALLVAPGSTARRGLLFAALAYAGLSALFIVTDRYRLPLAALLLPVAATAFSAPAARWRRPAALVGVAVAALVAFRPVPYDPRETWTEDWLLSAQAAGDVGEHAMSERLARLALERESQRSMGWELVCNARYNLLSARLPEAPRDAAWERDALAACANPAVLASQSRALGAVFRWRAGERDAARAAWRRLVDERGPGATWATVFLVAIGDLAPPAGDDADLPLLLARVLRGDAAARAALVRAYGPDAVEREVARMRALLML